MKNIIINLKSGFFISLIALPLCLGIALASSCPPIAGVITAIIGGLIISFIGGSPLSIKGPAAGLIAVVLAAVTDLGGGDLTLGYKRMLAVAVVAAGLQIIFALFKLARFGRLMPPSVIHGMLAAIGVIILAKQIHLLVGVKPHAKTPFQLIFEIPHSIQNMNPELIFIGLITMCIILLLPMIPSRLFKSFPPALFALLVVVPLGLYWHLDNPHSYSIFQHNFQVGPESLVHIPASLLNSLVFPDFSILTSALAYKYVLMLALVGSIESVLTVIAVDSITKGKSNLDRDLLGIGVGNLLAASVGGLPMISEVVRSKANIDSGATLRWSNFFHGAFLLLFVLVLAPIINEISLAALAAMLMITGFRLASPKQFLHVREIGLDQLLLFSTTLLVTLATDLLVGITTGCLLKIAIHLIRGVKPSQFFRLAFNIEENATVKKLSVVGPAIFTNFITLQKIVTEACLSDKAVVIDLSKTSHIDHTTISYLTGIQSELGAAKISLIGLDKLTRVSRHHLSAGRSFELAK